MRSTAQQSPSRRSDPPRQVSPTQVGYFAQELFNRLTPVAVCAAELRGLDLAPQMRELVEIIVHATARTVRTARGLARQGGMRLVSRTPCNPNDMVQAIEREFGPLCGALGIALTIQPDRDCQPVMLDVAVFRDGLAHVMDVVADACSMAQRGARSWIGLQVLRRGDTQVIVIKSDGEAVSEAAVHEAFATLGEAEPPSGGTALALFLARTAIAAGGGELRVGPGRMDFEILLDPAAGRLLQGAGPTGRPELRLILGSGDPEAGPRTSDRTFQPSIFVGTGPRVALAV